MQQLPLRVGLRETSRFANFVAGDNREAVDRLMHAADAGGVVWLWGRSGSGKTHLLQAACAAAGERNATATYVDLAQTPAPALLDGIEAVSVVCLDGLDGVAHDMEWNAALFRLYTLMQDERTTLVIASGSPPSALRFALPDLQSRLLAADVFQLRELDDSGLLEALQRRAAHRGLELSHEAADYLLLRLPRDMYTLCRVLDRLDDASLVAQRRLTVPFLREALASQSAGTA